jgi:DNA polymerase epsilon subunit 1
MSTYRPTHVHVYPPLLTYFLDRYHRPIVQQNQKRLASAEDYLFSGSHDDALITYAAGGGADVWDELGAPVTTSAASVGARAGSSANTKVEAAAIATDPLSYIIDFREHDVPYTVRASIDLDLRVGAWYTVTPEYGSECCQVAIDRSILELCEPRTLAFDIECEKSPLKFPNPETDRIFMISYMVKNQGFLIINR